MAKRILLIGGGGYVGTVLTSHFLKAGYKVRALDNFVYGNQFAISPYVGDPDYEPILGDMGDEHALEMACRDVDSVVILAGLVGDPITKKYPELSGRINEDAVRTCIDFLNGRGLDRVIFVSTCSNYGLIGENELADEEFHLNPLSLYAKAKVAAEQLVLSKRSTVDYTGVVLRFATAFGLSPRMRFDLTVSEFVRHVYFGQEMVVYDEHTWRPYCHLRDFARLIETVLDAPAQSVAFQVFNAGGEANNFTKKMICDEIVRALPQARFRYDQAGSDPRNYRVDFSKVRSVLGFEPKFNVRDGVEELVQALQLGLYSDSMRARERYGNYIIESAE